MMKIYGAETIVYGESNINGISFLKGFTNDLIFGLSKNAMASFVMTDDGPMPIIVTTGIPLIQLSISDKSTILHEIGHIVNKDITAGGLYKVSKSKLIAFIQNLIHAPLKRSLKQEQLADLYAATYVGKDVLIAKHNARIAEGTCSKHELEARIEFLENSTIERKLMQWG